MSFPKYWTWTKCTPQKIVSFWSNPYKIVVILTSLTEMLELLNFVYMTTSTIWFESRDKMLLVTLWANVMTSLPLFQITFISRRPRLANFGDIIKIATMFIKATFKDSKKVQRIRNYVLKLSIDVFLVYNKSCWFPVKKCWCQHNSWSVLHDL